MTRRRQFCRSASLVLVAVVSTIHLLQPDWLSVVTLVPPWCWLVPGFLLLVCGATRTHKFWILAALTIWIAYVAVFVEEAASLARSDSGPSAEFERARENGRGIRVVSLNCATANWRAAGEVATWDPDIVLLQESPIPAHLESLAAKLFGDDGSYLWGGDTALIVRGTIQPRRVNRSSHFAHAIVELTTGITAEVVSVRLNPPVFRLDFWSPGFWNDHFDNRVLHRRELLEVMKGIRHESTPLIVGGDLNTPPNDAALKPLREQLVDTFCSAGRGWGNTGTNEYPLFRVDQIWASRDLRPNRVTAEKTVHSDHRLVVCDLIIR